MAPPPSAPSSLALVAPSLLTLAALGCGMTAIREATRGSFAASLFWLGVSAVCDGLDGHVARRLGAVTQFGGELDSLCDLVDFGAAPALIVHAWATRWDAEQAAAGATPAAGCDGEWLDGLLWGCCLAYVFCAAYRLARFNVGTLRPAPPPGAAGGGGAVGACAAPVHAFSAPHLDLGGAQDERRDAFATTYISRAKFFRGVPAPQGALMAVAPIVLALRAAALAAAAAAPGGGGGVCASAASALTCGAHASAARGAALLLGGLGGGAPCARAAAGAWLCAVGALMVSTLPMLSSKMLMRDPASESHFRSRSVWSMLAKGCAALTLCAWLLSVRGWRLWALEACALLQACALLSLPLGPLAYRYVAS